MPATYTISESASGHWVATNGARTVEDDSPENALFGLLGGEIETDFGSGEFDDGPKFNRRERASESTCRACVRIIQLLTLAAPEEVLRREVENISRHVEEWIVG